jgi:6,7-dimethyl-8-ribityllumazine synthase
MAKQKVAFIQANWHEDMNSQARAGFGERMGSAVEITDHKVPGALELPLAAQKLARTGEYGAIVCCAFVVDGGIYRHDFVAQAVLDGIMRVNLDEGVPVLSVSLTPHHYHEIKEHKQFYRKHMVKKGEEAAEAVAMLLDLKLTSIPSSGKKKN